MGHVDRCLSSMRSLRASVHIWVLGTLLVLARIQDGLYLLVDLLSDSSNRLSVRNVSRYPTCRHNFPPYVHKSPIPRGHLLSNFILCYPSSILPYPSYPSQTPSLLPLPFSQPLLVNIEIFIHKCVDKCVDAVDTLIDALKR